MTLKKNKPTRSSQASKKLADKIVNGDRRNQWLMLLAILLITFIAYMPALQNGFLRWDDDKYIQNNALIFSFNLKDIFSTYVWGNYHPLTILAYAIEYHLFGFSAKGFHTVNLLLHLFNTILVFYAVLYLSDKKEIAAVASLLFGVHPLHVESVAWIAELKDLLYTLFFLTSYIFYIKYLKHQQRKYYLYALAFFVLSLLSKAMAASLPVVLLLTDYFKRRKMGGKAWVEKAPFFLLSIVFGVVAIFAQQSTNSILDVTMFTFPERIVFACYGFITYIIKLILPLNLSAFYPYPLKDISGIPSWYYVYPPILIAFAGYVIYSLYTSVNANRDNGAIRKIIFGLGFFSATVFLVLQLLPIGGAIMAERYSYIPSIGIFYLAGEGFYWLWNKRRKTRMALALGSFVIIIFFSAKTFARCSVWVDDKTLWNDIIEQYQTVPLAYTNRGNVLMEEKKFEEALKDYNKAIELSPTFADAYLDRGSLFLDLKKQEEAMRDFAKAIELRPRFVEAFVNRGIALNELKRYEEAIRDYSKAIEINPRYTNAYTNRGNILMEQKKYDEAAQDFNMVIRLQPDFSDAYYNRGVLLMNQKKYDEAISDYSKAIELNRNSPEPYYYRALIEYNTQKKDMACTDLQQAANLGYQPAIDAFNQFCH